MRKSKKIAAFRALCFFAAFFICTSSHASTYKERKAFSDISPFYKWTDVIRRMDAEQEELPAFSKLDENRISIATVKKINESVNEFRFIDDESGWGKSDYWQTPQEFFAAGGGDCEDFAIAKYAWLKSLGLQEENMRIAIVRDKFLQSMHTLLLVNVEGKSLILDNQEKKTEGFILDSRYDPIFSFNRQAWWLY